MRTTNRPTKDRDMSRRFSGSPALPILLLALLPLAAACNDDELLPPTARDDMFVRYVAIGNSITAGFQSGGISDSTQLQAYPVLLAEEFGLSLGTEFNVPLLNPPGCPPPIINIFTLERLGGGGSSTCLLRQAPTPTFINNVAVPGAAVVDVLNNLDPTSRANALTTFFLGGLTQMEVVQRVRPTFASVWIGNNDVLGAALSGDVSLVTPASVFAAQYDAMVDELVALNLQGAILIGVGNVTAIPHLSPGAAYWQAAMAPGWPPTFTVSNNCAPAAFGGVGETTLVPFGYGFGVLFAQAAGGTAVTLDCVNDPPVLTGAELATIGTAVAIFNQTIADAAGANGWAYLDPNPFLDSLVQAGEIPLFPNVPPSPDAVTRPFGDFFSRDGFHPNAAAHQLVADHVIDAINAEYGVNLQRVARR